jgi:protein SCO1/2
MTHSSAWILRSALALAGAGSASAQGIGGGLEVVDANIVVKERFGEQVPPDLQFTDERGATVRLGDFFTGKRPVILNLGYYGCPAMCGALLNGMVDALKEVALEPGQDFEVLSVSFDPSEDAALAAAKKAAYLEAYGRPGAADHWRFLTGAGDQSRRLADAVGFGFVWNEFSKQFDHSACLVFLSPQGKVARYLYGLAFEPRDVKFAVLEAAEGSVGSVMDQLVLSCYAYDPRSRTYNVLAWSVVRAGGIATLVLLGIFVLMMVRRERRRAPMPEVVTP